MGYFNSSEEEIIAGEHNQARLSDLLTEAELDRFTAEMKNAFQE